MKQVFFNGSPHFPAIGTNLFNVIGGWHAAGCSWGSVESQRFQVAQIACTVRRLRVMAFNATPDGSWTFTIMKNGSASALTCTVTAGNLTAIDSTNEITLAAGDTISIRLNGAGTQNPSWAWCTEWEYDTPARYSVITACSIAMNTSAGTTRHDALSGGGAYSATINPRQRSIVSHDATIREFRFRLTADPGVGASRTISILKNDVEEASSIITISDTNNTGAVTGLNIDVAPGDTLTVKHLNSNPAPAAARGKWTTVFEPDVDGESMCFGSEINFDTGSGTLIPPLYFPAISCVATAIDLADEVPYQICSNAFELKKFYITFDSALVGGSFTTTFQKDAALEPLTVEVLEGFDSGSDLVNVAEYADANKIIGNVDYTGAVDSVAQIGFVQFIEPPTAAVPQRMLMGVGV